MQARAVLLDGDVVVATWPVDVRRADMTLVDRLARAQLWARRAGYELCLSDVSDALAELLDLVGLSVEMGGEPERLEQRGVEKVVLRDDPLA